MARGTPNITKRRDANTKKRKQRNNNDNDDDEFPLPNKDKKSKKQNDTDDNRPKKMSQIHALGSIKHSTFLFKKCFWSGAAPEAPPSEDLKALRKSLAVNVKGALDCCPPPIQTLSCNGLPPSFKAVFDRVQYTVPTAIQKQAWPAVLAGANVLGIAPTGSGKTFAFGLPMIPHILDQPDIMKNRPKPSPTCLVLVPTRELAVQVTQTLKPLRQLFKIRSLAVYGGVDRHSQIEQLSVTALHILVATPGRLLDLKTAGEISLDCVTYMVIDEADRMLALGFEEQLNAVSQFVRPDRQTLLFSATFPGKLRDVSAKWLSARNESGSATAPTADKCVIIRVNTLEFNDVKATPSEKKIEAKAQKQAQETIVGEVSAAKQETKSDDLVSQISEKQSEGEIVEAPVTEEKKTRRTLSLTVSRSIKQHVHVCASHKKPRLLIKYITRIREQEKAEKVRQAGSMLIFCTKVKTLQFAVQFLEKNGISVAPLHGQMLQKQREQVLADFKAGKIKILCATDVASRGIHIKRLKYVVNYDFPGSLEQYCHRVGRTGRQDAGGDAYSLLTRNMAPLAEDLISLLESCDQVVEPNLLALKEDYIGGGFVMGEGEEEEGDDDEDEDEDEDDEGFDSEGSS
jgi:superfamily II DNA/RNA helicase